MASLLAVSLNFFYGEEGEKKKKTSNCFITNLSIMLSLTSPSRLDTLIFYHMSFGAVHELLCLDCNIHCSVFDFTNAGPST